MINRFLEAQHRFYRELIEQLESHADDSLDLIHRIGQYISTQSFSPAISLLSEKTGTQPVENPPSGPPSSVLVHKVFNAQNDLLATLRYDQQTMRVIFSTPQFTEENPKFKEVFGAEILIPLLERNPKIIVEYEKAGGKIREIRLKNLPQFSDLALVESKLKKLLAPS